MNVGHVVHAHNYHITVHRNNCVYYQRAVHRDKRAPLACTIAGCKLCKPSEDQLAWITPRIDWIMPVPGDVVRNRERVEPKRRDRRDRVNELEDWEKELERAAKQAQKDRELIARANKSH